MGVIPSNPSDNLPKSYSYQGTKTLIGQLNAFCKQNAKQLGFLLHLRASELQYNHYDWKKSIVSGTIVLKNESRSISYNILMNLKSIYKSHETMKHFQKRLSDSIINTPSDETTAPAEECCICMDKTPTMMLPCYHTFCPNCTQIHIIDQEEKKCPICRIEFHEDGFSLKSKIITVVGDQQSLINDVKLILLGYLKELSLHQVREIQKELKVNQSKKAINNGQLAEHQDF